MADINVTIEDAQPINVNMGEAVNYFVSDVPGPQGEQGEQGPPGNDGVIQSVVAGENITIDNTDPANPVIASTGGGGGGGAALVGQTILSSNDHTLAVSDFDPSGEGGYFKVYMELRFNGGYNAVQTRINGTPVDFNGYTVNEQVTPVTSTHGTTLPSFASGGSKTAIIEMSIVVAPPAEWYTGGTTLVCDYATGGTFMRYKGHSTTVTSLTSVGIDFLSVSRKYIAAGSKISVYKYS